MKTPLLASLAALVLSGVAATANATTYTVFRATAFLPGFIQQQSTTGGPMLVAGRLDTARIINLAMGQPIDAPVPANQILAAAIGDDNTGQLIVFDTNTSRVLVTVGLVPDRRRAENNPRSGQSFVRVGTGGLCSSKSAAPKTKLRAAPCATGALWW